jgi:hypothetical protein
METVKGKVCEVCGESEAVVIGTDCRKALGEKCRVLDIWGYGCGHGNPMFFSRKRDSHPTINLLKAVERAEFGTGARSPESVAPSRLQPERGKTGRLFIKAPFFCPPPFPDSHGKNYFLPAARPAKRSLGMGKN